MDFSETRQFLERNKFRVRYTKLSDASIISNFDKKLNPFFWSADQIKNSLLSNQKGFSLIWKNEVIGACIFSALKNFTSELYLFLLDTPYHGTGLSQYLLQVYELYCINTFFVKEMFLDVRHSNVRAIRFYKKNGYKILTVRKFYYRTLLSTEHSFVMSKHCIT